MSDFKLHKIYEPSNEDTVADIVFIHGLDGDAKKTWNYKDKKGEIFWPNWLIGHFPLLQIWTLDHPSKMFASLTKGDEMDFFKRTVAILDYLISNDIGLRPLIFVCHSLGGVLTKALLRKSQDTDVEEYKGIIENTLGVVFLATPHSGTSLANYANFTFSPFSEATKELKKENPILVDLYAWYRSNAPQKNIATKAFFET